MKVIATLFGIGFFFSCLPAARAISINTDSDGDGLSDAWEVQAFQTDPTKADTDGDGHNDRTEVIQNFNPMGSGPLLDRDFDQDGLSDRLELLFGSDPLVIDTDQDGFSDGVEVKSAHSPTSSGAVPLKKSITISLKHQRLEQRVANIAIASFPVSGGLPRLPTPKGEFKVVSKTPRAWSNLASLWMPYWMNFSGPKAPRGRYGIHELPEWPGGKKEGSNHLGRPASHGCVRLGVGPAKQLYEWTPVGTPVIISYD